MTVTAPSGQELPLLQAVFSISEQDICSAVYHFIHRKTLPYVPAASSPVIPAHLRIGSQVCYSQCQLAGISGRHQVSIVIMINYLGIPPTLEAITAFPAAIASSTDIPNPSDRLGSTNISTAFI